MRANPHAHTTTTVYSYLPIKAHIQPTNNKMATKRNTYKGSENQIGSNMISKSKMSRVGGQKSKDASAKNDQPISSHIRAEATAKITLRQNLNGET